MSMDLREDEIFFIDQWNFLKDKRTRPGLSNHLDEICNDYLSKTDTISKIVNIRNILSYAYVFTKLGKEEPMNAGVSGVFFQ